MSFGLVSVVGNSGGPTDFVEDRTTGLIVDGSVQERIENALRELIDGGTARHQMSQAAQKFALNFLTWDNHVEQVENMLSNASI